MKISLDKNFEIADILIIMFFWRMENLSKRENGLNLH